MELENTIKHQNVKKPKASIKIIFILSLKNY